VDRTADAHPLAARHGGRPCGLLTRIPAVLAVSGEPKRGYDDDEDPRRAMLWPAFGIVAAKGSSRFLTTRTPSSIALDAVASPLWALPCLETLSSHMRLSHAVHSGVSQASPHQVPHLLRACRGRLHRRVRVMAASAASRRYPGQSLGEKMPAVGAGTGIEACHHPCRAGAWLRRDRTRSWP
jgi:hypothetical protein